MKDNGINNVEKEVFPVVDQYLENSAAGNWKEVYETLSGEALAEARANSGRVKAEEKVITKNFELNPVVPGVVEVTADFTVSVGGEFDRLSYKFRLKKAGEKWLIYKTEYGQYIHGELRHGQLPPEAADVIGRYIEMPFKEKHFSGQKYLAGKMLQESKRASHLPVDSKSVKEQGNVSVRVKAVECLGLSEGFAMARVSYEVIKNSTAYPMEVALDVLDVNGSWRICSMDVL